MKRRNRIRTIGLLGIFAAFSLLRPAVDAFSMNGQTSPNAGATAILADLNPMLENFCYNKPRLELAGGGTVIRKDSDGTTWKFDFREIADIVIDLEGEAHVVLHCRGGAGCIEQSTNAGSRASPLLAFSIRPADRGEAILKLFKDLQAALGSGGKKWIAAALFGLKPTTCSASISGRPEFRFPGDEKSVSRSPRPILRRIRGI